MMIPHRGPPRRPPSDHTEACFDFGGILKVDHVVWGSGVRVEHALLEHIPVGLLRFRTHYAKR